MNKPTFDAMVAQYAVKEASGEGAVSWENGVRCVLPSVEIGGKAVQDGAPTPDEPVMPEFSDVTTVKACGKNLFDISQIEYGAAINGGGIGAPIDSWPRAYACTVWCIPVKPDTSYAISYDNTDVWMDRLCEMDADDLCTENWAWYSGGWWQDPGPSFILKSKQATTYFAVRFALRDTTATMTAEIMASINVQIEEGTTATPYTPYFDGGTAVAPELLAIPGTEYMDEWNPQTGKGVRRCATIESYAGEAITTPYISSTGTLSDGAYIVYGIADTPFETTPQPLTAPPGTGHIMQVGGTIDAVPITAKYVTHS